MSPADRRAASSQPSLGRRLATGVANSLLVLVGGHLGLVVLLVVAWLVLPLPGEVGERAFRAIEPLYGGYALVVAAAALFSFVYAFSGFSVARKLSEWSRKRRS